MSRAEGKSEVQVPCPGHTFPFGSSTVPQQPHVTQWCRFSVPERLPLQPFRQDRLTRLPLPPSLMATSKMTSLSGAGVAPPLSSQSKRGGADDVDPFQKIQQLEKNLAFVRENHIFLLQGLHKEIAELKQKNRELQFELITGLPALPKESNLQAVDNDSPSIEKDKIEKLEKEIRKLRGALKDAIKSNTALTSQLQFLSRDQHVKTSSQNREYNRTPSQSVLDDDRTPSGPSPQMEEYSDTLKQIQRAATQRSGRRNERRRHHYTEGKTEWAESYERSFYPPHPRHHHQAQKSPQPQQARLPRLPLRNHQNYTHQQYEIQYRQRTSNILPALKQHLVPVVEHHIEKSRKSRAPRPTKVDHVING